MNTTSPRQLAAPTAFGEPTNALSEQELADNTTNESSALADSESIALIQYTPEKTIRDFGRAGWFRACQLSYFLIIFTLRLYLDKLVRTDKSEVVGFKQRVIYTLARYTYPSRHLDAAIVEEQRAVWFSNWLAYLGPTFIKIGQTLSTRPDIVPLTYTKALTKLQDQVPSFPSPLAWDTIQQELGANPEDIFASIEPEPLAAASLGQVYRARLKTGEVVAVKVQRPNLPAIINLDLAILRQAIRYIENKHPEWLLGIELLPIVDEFAGMLFEEMDYLQEERNAEVFRQNFAKWPEIYVPHIYSQYSTRRILVEEFIEGLKVDDFPAVKAAGHDPLEVIKLASRTYLKQLLEDGFFHADPHPGNLRLMADGRLAFFDFGMVGRLSADMQSKLVDSFFHIVERDVPGLVDDLIALKFLKPGFDEEEIRPAIEEVFSHYIGMKIGQLKFRELVYAISETIYRLPFTIPPQVTFVMRALTTLEGIGILYDSNFSFFETIKPYAKEFMLKQEGKQLRDKLLSKLVRGENGNISWSKVWKLAKMAVKHYFSPKDAPPTKQIDPSKS